MSLDAFLTLKGQVTDAVTREKYPSIEILGETQDEDIKDPNAVEIKTFKWAVGSAFSSDLGKKLKKMIKKDKDLPPEMLAALKKAAVEAEAKAKAEEADQAATSDDLKSKLPMSAFTISKDIDYASPNFFMAFCMRCHFATGKVMVRKWGGQRPFPFLFYNFADVTVRSFDWDVSVDGTYTETLSFGFHKCEITYKMQTKSGAQSSLPPKVGGWDLDARPSPVLWGLPTGR